ncbi:hypothetical protein KKC44_04240 [Patescibacteria group bacterium]|nr:hypothetical protein [Patescibacteria group bacterium]MBU2259788.1 hypothetical protein [Patescibacteria group bacterium]
MSKRILISAVTGVLLVSTAVPALAFGFGRGQKSLDALPDELQQQIASCEEKTEDVRQCHKDIMEQYREENGLEGSGGFMMSRKMRMHGPDMNTLPAEVQAQIQSCKDNNEDQADARKCSQEVLNTYREANGLEVLPSFGMGFGRRGGFQGAGIMRLAPDEVKEELKDCQELETWEEIRSCVLEALQ